LSSAALEAATSPDNPPPTTRTSTFAADMAAYTEASVINFSSITETDFGSATPNSPNMALERWSQWIGKEYRSLPHML
jgi:hypothetical protein